MRATVRPFRLRIAGSGVAKSDEPTAAVEWRDAPQPRARPYPQIPPESEVHLPSSNVDRRRFSRHDEVGTKCAVVRDVDEALDDVRRGHRIPVRRVAQARADGLACEVADRIDPRHVRQLDRKCLPCTRRLARFVIEELTDAPHRSSAVSGSSAPLRARDFAPATPPDSIAASSHLSIRARADVTGSAAIDTAR